MNLKEAFRYQNKLQQLMGEGQAVLYPERNVTRVTLTNLRHKVMPEERDEVIEEVPATEYAEHINHIARLLMYFLDQRSALSYAIRKAKQNMEMDFDSEVSLNSDRQELARLFRNMGLIRSSEVTIPGGGTGYRFNADGNQVPYRCDQKKVTTIYFDRNKVRGYAAALNQQSDTISSELDRAMVNTYVDYQPPFDVNYTFAEVLDWFAESNS